MSAVALRRLVLTAAALTPLAAAAQSGPPLRDLPKPTREIDDPYSLIAAVREVGGGRVVVVDGLDGELSVVDFAAGSREPLGRQGSGPGEYRVPGALFRVRGDTLWVLDPAQQRITVFLPDLKAGVPFHMPTFDTQTRTALTMPFNADAAGRVYASGMPVVGDGRNMQIPDSVEVLRFDPRASEPRTALTKVRFPTSGQPQMRVEGQVIRYSMQFPGLVTADSWAVFPDGRVAIVRGATYSVELIAADGKRTMSKPIPYDRIPVTKEDQEAEMVEARRVLAEQSKAIQRTLPSGMTMDIQMSPPASWPSEYPAIAPMAAFASPDGMLWVRRSAPVKLDRERWDVIDASGQLVASWQLPKRTRLVGVGAGAVYTVRLDEDDLQYLQRVEVRR